MRERPNTYYQLDDSSTELRNDLYRALEPTFEHLLRNDDPEKHSGTHDGYVNHPVMEEIVRSFCSNDTSAVAFLIGATGIGKSTLLRHTLNVNRSPHVSNGTLFIPMSLNQRHIKDKNDLRRQLGRLFQDSVWHAKPDQKREYTEQDLVELCQFLIDTSPDLIDDPSLDLTKAPLARTKALVASQEFGYQFAQVALKFFVSKNRAIKRSIIIIDDLEGTKEASIQEEAVTLALESRACLVNAGSERPAMVGLLVAVRPQTHAWISRLGQVKTVGFRDLAYTKPVDLHDIFQKRFLSSVDKKHYEHLHDQNRLSRSLGVLKAVGELVAGKYTTRMVELNNNDLRMSIETFRRVTCNRRWLQRDPEWTPHFSIEEHNFAVSQASVIRALGMGEGEVYPQKNTCLSNLLWNTREETSDFILIYIIKYLLHKPNHTATKTAIFGVFEKCLGTAYDADVFNEVYEYAVNHGLLHLEKSPETERLTLSPRSTQLYELLGDTTLLLAQYSDDLCQETKGGRPPKPNMHLGSATESFLQIGKLIFLQFILSSNNR